MNLPFLGVAASCLRSPSRPSSEVHAQAGGVRLTVLVGALRKNGEIRRLDAHEDPSAQRQEESSPCAGEKEVFTLEDEGVLVRQDAQPPGKETDERADRPAWGEVDADSAPVNQLSAVARQPVAD